MQASKKCLFRLIPVTCAWMLLMIFNSAKSQIRGFPYITFNSTPHATNHLSGKIAHIGNAKNTSVYIEFDESIARSLYVQTRIGYAVVYTNNPRITIKFDNSQEVPLKPLVIRANYPTHQRNRWARVTGQTVGAIHKRFGCLNDAMELRCNQWKWIQILNVTYSIRNRNFPRDNCVAEVDPGQCLVCMTSFRYCQNTSHCSFKINSTLFDWLHSCQDFETLYILYKCVSAHSIHTSSSNQCYSTISSSTSTATSSTTTALSTITTNGTTQSPASPIGTNNPLSQSTGHSHSTLPSFSTNTQKNDTTVRPAVNTNEVTSTDAITQTERTADLMESKDTQNTGAIIGGLTGGVIVMLTAAVILIVLYKRKQCDRETKEDGSSLNNLNASDPTFSSNTCIESPNIGNEDTGYAEIKDDTHTHVYEKLSWQTNKQKTWL